MRDGVLVSEVRVRGPLAGYAAGFAECLAARGYTPGSVRLQMQLAAQLSRWLGALTPLSASRAGADGRERACLRHGDPSVRGAVRRRRSR